MHRVTPRGAWLLVLCLMGLGAAPAARAGDPAVIKGRFIVHWEEPNRVASLEPVARVQEQVEQIRFLPHVVLLVGDWGGRARGSASCVTDADGVCSVSKRNLKSGGSAQFTVTDVQLAGYSFTASSNDSAALTYPECP